MRVRDSACHWDAIGKQSTIAASAGSGRDGGDGVSPRELTLRIHDLLGERQLTVQPDVG